MAVTRRFGLVWVLVLMLGPWQAICQAANPTITREQVAQGRQDYRAQCAECHGARLEGQHLSPPLTGARFDQTWRGKSAGILAFHMRRMPQEPVGKPGSLSEETYGNILAYILQANGFEMGDKALPTTLAALNGVTIPNLPGSKYDPDKPVVAAGESELLNNLSPITDEMLRNPAPGDWLLAGRTYDGSTYSPLKTINRDNVGELSMAWRAPLRNGASMPTPMVHDGVMFLHTFPDTVLAMDATNGQVLWRHQYKVTSGASSQKMGLGLHGDKVLVPTSDLHVLALKAKTGELIWDHQVVEPAVGVRGGYNLRSAPLVIGDKVIQGVTASFVPKGGFSVALNIDTGEEEWRFNTIARPGEEYGNSWNGLPLEKRSGGSVWHQGTYDPELDLIFYGVAPTYDTGPLVTPIDNESVTSNALYTNCTVALRPATGELVWHYQHMPNDQWDLDWVFERQIATIPVKGKDRKVVWNIGKMAILDALDAETGEYLFSVDSGIQNVITHIDPVTGAKTIDPGKWPDPNRDCEVCPSAYGARSWPATSYSPKTKLVYVPITESCMSLGQIGIPLLTSGVKIGPATHPDSADGLIGRMQAIDVVKQELAWVSEQVTPISTAALSTGGGLVFSGDTDPSLKAFDDSNGELLWQATLDDNPSSNLVTYSVGDTQYVAVVVGMKNFHIDALAGALMGVNTGTPRNNSPKGGAAIWVFAL